MISVGIVGGAGYTAGELMRLLIHHPNAQVRSVVSQSHAGQPVTNVHKDLRGECALSFEATLTTYALDVVFLCSGHGKAREFLKATPLAPSTKVIDLGRDFRLHADAAWQGERFVYGLPEVYRTDIQQARYVANPGCFATAIQLALLPLAQAKQLHVPAHVHAITGSTGAGQGLSPNTHYSWRNNNVSVYKPFAHQHLDEIHQTLTYLQHQTPVVHFLPLRGNFTRGIFATAYLTSPLPEADARALYQGFYQDAALTFVSEEPLSLKEVVNTAKCFLHVEKHGEQLLITSVIDNLLKGASGQAVQNMNLMCGLPETAGLYVKGSAF